MNTVKKYCLQFTNLISEKIYNFEENSRLEYPLFNHNSYKIKVSLSSTNGDYSKKYRKIIRFDFGDGTIVDGTEAIHYYKEPGRYIIKCLLFTIDKKPIENLVPQLEVYVKETLPTEISFLDIKHWENKSICHISKNNFLGNLQVTVANDIISDPLISAFRAWENGKNENSYFDISSEKLYHLKPYYSFLEESEIISPDQTISDISLKPVEYYTPKYIPIYGKFINDNENIKLDVYAVTNQKLELLSHDTSKLFFEQLEKSRLVNTVNSVASLDKIPNDYTCIGKIGISKIWYKNDITTENNLIFEFKKDTLKYINEKALRETYLNIPNIGFTLETVDENENNNEVIIKAFTSNGIFNIDHLNLNEELNKFALTEKYIKHNFYYNYPVDVYYSYFIKNDVIENNEKISFNLLKYKNEPLTPLLSKNSEEGDCIIKKVEDKKYFHCYEITPLKDNFQLMDDELNILYEHGELVNLEKLILPSEKDVHEDVDRLLNVYMEHPMYENTDKLKLFLKNIFENNNMLSYIITKSKNFNNDNVNYKTCYIDKFLSILEMLDEPYKKYEINSFEKINTLKELTRVLSMNYSELFGNIITDNYDIKITDTYTGKNVADKLEYSDTILCDADYNIIGFRRDKKIYKLIKSSPFIIIKDDFTSKTRLGSFYNIDTIQCELFDDQTEKWITDNKKFIDKVKFAYKLSDYTYNWGWSLNLPKEINSLKNKDKLIDSYYSFYLFNSNYKAERKYNFVKESTIPKSKKEKNSQITVDEWQEYFGFTYDCLLKVLSDILCNK